MTRYARQYVLLDASDCDPPHGLDLSPGSRDLVKVERLQAAFEKDGWDPNEPVAVGYPLNGRIQLANATHRHEASRRAGTKLPVHLMLRSRVEAIWGTPAWLEFLREVPVKHLEFAPIMNTPEPGLDERVDLVRDLK
jgi:hypothetical protein